MTREKLELFVSGTNSRTEKLERSVCQACGQAFPAGFELTLINVFENFELADEKDVFATPTLLKLTEPACRIVGDLTDGASLLSRLEIVTERAKVVSALH